MKRDVLVPAGSVTLPGVLEIPAGAPGIVLFAHGSGSSRHSPRNRFVAQVIRDAGIGTLLFDLLTPEEERADAVTAAWRFDIELLAQRLAAAAEWLAGQPEGRGRKLGFFGASTGGGAALVAAARLGDRIAGVVSRGGRPDLAGAALPEVVCPVLLIVGGLDEVVIGLNEEALTQLHCPKELRIVPGATHLFVEPGALEEVARMTADWFRDQLGKGSDIARQH
jgi:dienelactone hydrolase